MIDAGKDSYPSGQPAVENSSTLYHLQTGAVRQQGFLVRAIVMDGRTEDPTQMN
jgi:hypothetical protein